MKEERHFVQKGGSEGNRHRETVQEKTILTKQIATNLSCQEREVLDKPPEGQLGGKEDTFKC